MSAPVRRLSVRDLPAGERPRERLLAEGAGALTVAQLVALILAEGTRGETAIDCAQRLPAWKCGRSLRRNGGDTTPARG